MEKLYIGFNSSMNSFLLLSTQIDFSEPSCLTHLSVGSNTVALIDVAYGLSNLQHRHVLYTEKQHSV